MAKFNLKEILELEKYYRISLLNKISGLKSANLIGTRNENGISNLAIFNSVTHIGANPPFLGIIVRPLLVERQTYSNIKTGKYFTINQVTEQIHKQAHQSSAKYENNVSEFEECGLKEENIDDFPAPFVKESPIKIGLSYKEEHLITANNTILVIGKIEQIMLPDKALKQDGDIELDSLNAIAVGGLDSYYSCNRIGRYEYARPGKEFKKID